MNRRKFITTSIATGATAAAASGAAGARDKKSVRIVGVSCSPRKGKTTATAVQTVLDAAKEVDPRIEVELIDLGGMQIAGSSGTSSQLADDFDKILPKLKDPVPDGLIIGC